MLLFLSRLFRLSSGCLSWEWLRFWSVYRHGHYRLSTVGGIISYGSPYLRFSGPLSSLNTYMVASNLAHTPLLIGFILTLHTMCTYHFSPRFSSNPHAFIWFTSLPFGYTIFRVFLFLTRRLLFFPSFCIETSPGLVGETGKVCMCIPSLS